MIEVPKAFRGTPSATQALRLTALLVIIALGWTAFFVQHIVTGMRGMAITDAAIVVLTTIVLFWATRGGEERRLTIAAHLAMVLSVGGIIAVSMLSGQDAAMASWYLTAVPLFSAYALGIREAVAWAIVSLVVMVGIYVSPHFVQFEPEYVPNETTWAIGRVVLLSVLVGLAVASRRATDLNVDALAQRELIIRERARELAEARDEALAAVRAKDQFLANMSHEIRTPLNGIIGMTSVLLDADQPEDQREMVKTIQRSSTALLAVLNEILDYSKLEASAAVLEHIPFDLRECIEDAIDLLSRNAIEKGLDLYVRMERDVPPWIEGDITYVRQILLNLIGNAIKFTERGEVAVFVSAPSLEQLHFEVRDTGIGIPADKHNRLFRSFSQVDASTTRKYGGTGLGLAISKRLTELMGGEIWVESTVGEGSSFHFTIEAEEAEPPVRPMTTHERMTLIGHPVVVVGGRAGSHNALVELLQSWGVRVTSRLDPAELSDADLGAEMFITYDDALDTVVKMDERPPVVLIAPVDADVRARATAIGVEALVFRPVRQRSLRQTIEAVIEGEPQRATESYTAFDPTMGKRLPARVLIGEDNPVNQRVAVTVLQKLGYDPDVAATGLDVLAALDRRDYDILFLDLQMPLMDGLETTRTIRARRDDNGPWIVALTASVGMDQRQLVHDVGMNDFVSKPFDVQTLMVAIERWGHSCGLLQNLGEALSDVSDESPWDQLRAMFSGSPERLAGLIEQHRKNGADLVEAIVTALEADDLDELATSAHSLKSSSAQFGSREVSALAASLEEMAREDADELAEGVDRLVAAWNVADARLASEIDELRGSAPERMESSG